MLHEPTLGALARGEGGAPAARPLTPCLACSSASLCFLSASSSSSAMARPSHVAQPQPPSGVAQPHRQLRGSTRRVAPQRESDAGYCAGARGAQASKIESRASAAPPLPGRLAEDRYFDDRRHRAALIGRFLPPTRNRLAIRHRLVRIIVQFTDSFHGETRGLGKAKWGLEMV